MRKIFNIQFITNSLLSIEKKYNLLNWEIEGIYVWQSARVNIYLKLIDSLIPQYSITSSTRNTSLNKLSILFKRVIINAIYYNPFFDYKKSDIIVFESPRKYKVDDDIIDIHTKYLCDNFDDNFVNYQKYLTSFSFDGLVKKRKKSKHIDFVRLIVKLIAKFISVNIDANHTKKIKLIEQEIRQIFDIKMDIFNIIGKIIRRFKVEYWLYYKLFSIKRPREIYLVNYCFQTAMIKAAKDNGSIVIEIQHGLMVKEDLIYHFPNSEKGNVAYFPDKFYIWNEMNTSIIPIIEDNIINYGNKHLENRLSKYKDIKKNEKAILIISQYGFSDNVATQLLKSIKDLQDYEITYKLHPNEQDNWKSYHKLVKLSEYKNVTIVDNNYSIYKLLAESKYVIGVYSAAVFEADYFDCNIILLNLPGVEMSQKLLSKERVKLLHDNDTLLKLL